MSSDTTNHLYISELTAMQDMNILKNAEITSHWHHRDYQSPTDLVKDRWDLLANIGRLESSLCAWCVEGGREGKPLPQHFDDYEKHLRELSRSRVLLGHTAQSLRQPMRPLPHSLVGTTLLGAVTSLPAKRAKLQEALEKSETRVRRLLAAKTTITDRIEHKYHHRSRSSCAVPSMYWVPQGFEEFGGGGGGGGSDARISAAEPNAHAQDDNDDDEQCDQDAAALLDFSRAAGYWVKANWGLPEQTSWASLRSMEEDIAEKKEMIAAIDAALSKTKLKVK